VGTPIWAQLSFEVSLGASRRQPPRSPGQLAATGDLIDCRRRDAQSPLKVGEDARIHWGGYGGLWRWIDDKTDYNDDDSCTPNYAHHSAPHLVNPLFTLSARSWQCGGQGFRSVVWLWRSRPKDWTLN
jgi:hypothetical protein